MQIRHFEEKRDLQKLEGYLREQYRINKNMTTWLPERLHDMLYRMRAQEAASGGAISVDYIFLWEEDGVIVGCILPDGENIYMSIKAGYEHLFESMLAYSEKNCLPLFRKAEDGSVKFWVAANDSLAYMQTALVQAGYARYPEEDYDNCVRPQETEVSVELPAGFRLAYGEEYPDEENKWTALHLGFHPDHELPGYRTDMQPYLSRKRSSLYPDCFECLVIDETTSEANNVCAYCFVYVDRQTRTALVEPVSTREKYQRRGIGKAMMHGVMRRCKEIGVEHCYVNSFGWRKKFYNAAGFVTEDTVGFWYKFLR